ncbi:MAG: hypothetical protein ACRDJY_02650 [Thermoleophilaceae bacterium]
MPFEVRHDDPAPQARAAATRSATERDTAVRERARRQTMAQRMLEGFRLSEFAARLRGRAK